MSALKPPTGNMTKVKLYKHVLWCEASLRNRKHRDCGACVNQMEKLVAVLPEEQSFSFHQRVHYEGSNRGDVIYPVQAPNWDEPCHGLSKILLASLRHRNGKPSLKDSNDMIQVLPLHMFPTPPNSFPHDCLRIQLRHGA